MRQININRQLMGLEDLTFGVGTETQTRAGQSVVVTKINAGNLPFDETQSLLDWAQSADLPKLSAMLDELIAIYNNLTMLGNVEGNLVMLNAVEDSLTMLNSIYTNISKIQTVDTNMAKIQNIGTHMPELSTIYTNLAMLQAVYNNLIMLNNVEDNLVAINSVNSNLTQLLAIYTQVIPNLTELLQVNENAAQVAADKITVNTDKLIVAQDKADVSVMKSAVESIYDSFDDRFLGAKTTDPLVDNDGNPLVDGALYLNSSAHALKVYSLDNTTWYTIPQIYLSGLLDVQLTSITTGDILNWNGTKWVNTRTPKFDTVQLAGGTGTEGTLSWNTDEGTVDIILPNGSVLQVGQEGIRKVRNSTASTITNGTVVMFDGTIGNSGRIKVKPFTGGFNEALYVYGIATQDIVAGADGIITTEGKIRGVNTTGTLVGETWAAGDILYAKPSNAGALTKVVPSDNQLKMVMASVIHAHTSGTLEIRFTPINENTWYTKVQTDTLIAGKIPKVTTPITKSIPRIKSDGTIENSAITVDDLGNIGSATQSFNGFGGTGLKNYIINGGMMVTQRGTVFLIPAGGYAFTVDRWLVENTTNQTLTVQCGVGFTVNLPSGKIAQRMRFSFDTAPTSGAVLVSQKIEDVAKIVGLFTQSCVMASSESLNIVSTINQNFGTSGSPMVQAYFPSFTIDSTTVTRKATISVPSVEGKTIGANNNAQLVYSIPIRTTNGLAFAQVQLEEGSVATPFENRPYGLELSLCQRYYQSYLSKNLEQGTRVFHKRINSNIAQILVFDNIQFPPMRTLPTISLSCLNGSTTRVNGVSNNGVIEIDWAVYCESISSFTIWKGITPGINTPLAFDAVLSAEI